MFIANLVVASMLCIPAQKGRQELVEVSGATAPTLAWRSEVLALRSEVLGEEFRLYVAHPPSFERSQRHYPVLLLLDGQHYFADVQSVVATLVGSGQIPELVLVGIESRDRRRDFTPEAMHLPDVGDRARADRTLDFLEHELLPALESGQRCGEPHVLLGHSHAAILVLHALARRPHAFSCGLALDAPTHLEDHYLVRELTATVAAAERPALRLVSVESRFGFAEDRWTGLVACARPGDRLVRSAMREESHESMVHAASYRALQQLFREYSLLEARSLSAVEVDERYRGLASAWGVELPAPEPLLRRVVEDLLMEGFGALAAAWLRRYEEVYGPAEDHDALVRRIEVVTALGEPQETVADLLALPRATPEQMREHLGTWDGVEHHGDGRSVRLRLRFWVEDGRVRGEFVIGRTEPMEIQFLHFRGDGALEFGYRNGMRPRGLIVYAEKVPGGVLEGEMEMRGVRFVFPNGMTPPPTLFELHRSKGGG